MNTWNPVYLLYSYILISLYMLTNDKLRKKIFNFWNQRKASHKGERVPLKKSFEKLFRVIVSHWHPVPSSFVFRLPGFRLTIPSNHVARRRQLPQTSRYFKKNANYLCLINIHDIRPHRYASRSNPTTSSLLELLSIRSKPDLLPASSVLTIPPQLYIPSAPKTLVHYAKDYGNQNWNAADFFFFTLLFAPTLLLVNNRRLF